MITAVDSVILILIPVVNDVAREVYLATGYSRSFFVGINAGNF